MILQLQSNNYASWTKSKFFRYGNITSLLRKKVKKATGGQLSFEDAAIGAGGLRLEPWFDQIGHSAANAATFLRICVA